MPEIEGPRITIYKGEDHDRDEGRAFVFTEDDDDDWPNLDGTVALVVGAVSYPAVIIDAATFPRQVVVELTAAQTASLTPGLLDYRLRATQLNGRIVRLKQGKAEIVA